MTRIVLLGLIGLAAMNAQSPAPSDTFAALEQAAQRSATAWLDLAKDLDTRVAHLLPCDDRAAAAINEVSRASDGRLRALSEYLQAAASNASSETNAARLLLTREAALAADDSAEQIDTAAEVAAIEKQMNALADSAKRQASLDDASKVLQQIDGIAKDRASLAEQRPPNAAAVQSALRNLVAAFEAREAALKGEAAAFEAERARWNGYYAARLMRSQTECSITKVAPAKPPAPGRGR